MAFNCTPVAIRHLKEEMLNAEIAVRVVHVWERKSFYNKEETLALEMLLLDAEDNLIQATIRKSIIFKFKNRINEGHLYKLSRFTVNANKGAEIATSGEVRIYFAYPTVVTEVHDLLIPRYGFKFVDFGDILSERVSDEHFIDVIGKFSGVGEVKTTKAGNSWMTIYLENIRKEKLACSVWNDYVGLVQAYVDACNRSTEPAIIVIRCVQRCQWEGEVRVTTTRHATRFYLNHAIPEVEAFIGELHNGEEPSDSNVISYISSESDDMLSGDNLSTISEIKKCQKAGKYVTVATIYDVDLNAKWYYDSCKHCTTKALKNDAGRWVCKRAKCIGSTEGSDTSIPRYQVKFRVIGTDNEVSEFVIFETQITSFTKVSAANMLSALEQNGRKDDIPDFDIFMDKQFVFKVEVHSKYNLEQNSKSYTVLSMSDDQDMVGRWATKYLDIKEAEVGSVCHDLKPKDCVAIAENKECPSESSVSDCLITPPLKRSLSKMLDASSDDDCEVRIMGDKFSATKSIIEDKFSATKKLIQVKVEKE